MAAIDSRTPGYLQPQEAHDEPINAIRQFVSELTGLDPKMVRRRWMQKPGTQPGIGVNWASVAVESVTSWGLPESLRTRGTIRKPESGFDRKRTHQTLRCSVWFFGPDALRYADDFREGAYLSQNADTLQSAGLTVQGVDDTIRRIPDFVAEQWVDRFEVTFRLGRQIKRTYGIRTIAGYSGVEIYPNK